MISAYQVDPVDFAQEWSFNGRFYAWVSFFHGLSLLTGRDVSAHDAFHGRIYHTEIFGPKGALFHKMDKVTPAEAEARLSFSQMTMDQLRINEAKYLIETAHSWKIGGMFCGFTVLVTAMATITYTVGIGQLAVAYMAIPALILPFLIGFVGKQVVRHLWARKRQSMGSFINALPWIRLSTPA